jgi:DNA-binding CsgD family transcriptional regulator
MYINAVSDLMAFLEREDLTESDICTHLATHTLRMLGVNGLFMCTVTDDGRVRNVASHGVRQAWDDFPLEEELPITDTLRNNRMVWLADMNEMEQSYPALAGYTRHSPSGSIVCLPMQRVGSVVGGLGFFSPDVLFPNPTTEAFLKTVTGLVALKLYLMHGEHPSSEPMIRDRLTDRQIMILTRLSRGDTNAQIASLIGYSESTVRQETMRLFDVLKVANRREARDWYLSHKALFASEGTQSA